MARMIDVAKKAGVSIKTVSRVLNNEPHVKESLREQVRAAAKEVGYVPSATARRLRSRRSYILHMISHSERSSYVNAIQYGAMQACQEHGYQLMVSLIKDTRELSDDELSEAFARIISASRPEGLILMAPHSNDPRLKRVLETFDVNIARIGPHDLEGLPPGVRIDERGAARDLTRHLISLGHRRIAFVRGKEDQSATHVRMAGYRDALDEAGLAFDEGLVRPGQFDFHSGLRAGQELLSLDDRPTAIFAANDDMAAGVIMAAHRLGLEPPQDVSVVGFDDSEVADKTWPALTTVHQPLLDYGRVAADLLVHAIGAEGGDPRPAPDSLLDYSIIQRDSAGPAPGAS